MAFGTATPLSSMTLADQSPLDWRDCRRPAWNRLLSAAGRSSLEQSWAYGDAMAAYYGQTVVRRVIHHDDAPVAVVQLFRKRSLGAATLIRIVRGPLWLPEALDEQARISICRHLRGEFSMRRREALFWIPELPDTPESHALMRAAGTRRMVTGLSSAWLDLSAEEEVLRAGLAGKWRNALRTGEKSGLKVRVSAGGPGLSELMGHYDAFRKRKRFVGPPGGFVTAIAEASQHSKEVMVVSAHSGREIVAGVVFIRHGISATYFVSWTSEDGRRKRAHNLLLWRGLLELKKSGTGWLDLGGLNTASVAGVARFKLGLNPEVFTLAGTYF
jgi:hypothetical protein